MPTPDPGPAAYPGPAPNPTGGRAADPDRAADADLVAGPERSRVWLRRLLDRTGGGSGQQVPRWLVRTGAGVALLAVVVVGGIQGRQAHPTPQAAPPQPAPPVASFTGPALTDPVPLRLLLASYTVAELDLETGRRTTIMGIPETPNGYRLSRLDGGTVLARAQGSCPHCPGPIYLIPAGSHDGFALRDWDNVIPAGSPDRLWGYRFAAGPAPDATTVRELDLAGHPTGPTYQSKPGATLIRGTVAGLLLSRTRQLFVVDPRTGETRYRLDGEYIAASADQVAWIDHRCYSGCALRVLDLRTGKNMLYPTPGRPFRAAFGQGTVGLAAAVSTELADGGHQAQVYLLGDQRPRPLSSPVSISVSLEWSGVYLLMATAGGLITDGPPALSAALYVPGWPQARRITGPGLSGAQIIPR